MPDFISIHAITDADREAIRYQYPFGLKDREIAGLRGETYKQFELASHRFRLVGHCKPIHYRDPEWRDWKTIDLNLLDDGGDFLCTENKVTAGFRKDLKFEKFYGLRYSDDIQYEITPRSVLFDDVEMLEGLDLTADFETVGQNKANVMAHGLKTGLGVLTDLGETRLLNLFVSAGSISDFFVEEEINLKGISVANKLKDGKYVPDGLGRFVFVHPTTGEALYWINPPWFKLGEAGDRIQLVEHELAVDHDAVIYRKWASEKGREALSKADGPVMIDTTTYYGTSSDGYLYRSSSTWSIARDWSTAAGSDDDDTRHTECIRCERSGSTFYIYRSYFACDTSAIPDTANINDADIYMYGYGSGAGLVAVQKSAWAATLDTGDYDDMGTYWGEVPSWTNSGYNQLDIPNSDVNKSGYTGWVAREKAHDYANNSFAYTANYFRGVYFSDYSGTSYDPKIVVDYTTETTYTRTLSLDARLAMTGTGTLSLDSRIERQGLTATLSLDSLLEGIKSGAVGLDALLEADGLTGSVSLDSLLEAVKSGAVSLDAVLAMLGTEAVDLDALLEAGGLTGSVSLDSLLEGIKSGAVDLDALIETGGLEATLSLDALLEGLKTGSVDLDALLETGGLTGSVSLDSLLEAVKSGAVSLDAVLAMLGTGTVDLDALLEAVKTGAVDLDAVLATLGTEAVSLDSLLEAAKSGAVDLDALIETGGLTVSLSLDALLEGIKSGAVSLDALIAVAGSASVSLDAILANETLSSVLLDALLETGGLTASLSLDALIMGIKSGSVDLDALIQAGGLTVSVSLDGLLEGLKTGAVDLDAVLAMLGTGSVDLDALLETAKSGTVDLDALIQAGGLEAVLALDGLLQLHGLNVSLDMDGLLALGMSANIDFDAILAGSASLAISLDAILWNYDVAAYRDEIRSPDRTREVASPERVREVRSPERLREISG